MIADAILSSGKIKSAAPARRTALGISNAADVLLSCAMTLPSIALMMLAPMAPSSPCPDKITPKTCLPKTIAILLSNMFAEGRTN